MENNQTKEKLLAEIERLKKELKKKKKYGLVWEEKPEDVVEMCKEKLPVLKEVKGKEIITDKNKPMNLLIEGDNYHALSVLNYTHKGKIDVIYIDPPYNTGKAKEWKYNDKYVDKNDGYRHSKWINMMEKRLKLAKNLLKKSGAIFISIDDHEQAQLRLLCDEIFKVENFVAIFPRTVGTVPKTTEGIQSRHDYVLCYGGSAKFSVDEDISIEHFKHNDNDGRGDYALIHPLDSGTIRYSKTLDYEIVFNKKKFTPGMHVKNKPIKTWLWRWCQDLVEFGFKNNLIIEKNNRLYTKNYKSLSIDENENGYFLSNKVVGKYYTTDTLMSEDYGNRVATRELKEILGKNDFKYPKPTNLIIKVANMIDNKSAVILDFFAGSGTTGHAILKLNQQDCGNRQFILCTNNENNIVTNTCYPRLQKAIKGYETPKEKLVNGLGGNLKYFKTDFVDYEESTDRNKIKLTKEAVEMLCVKEGTFESVLNNEDFKIFKNHDHYTGIIFDQLAIEDFKKAVKGIKGKISVYIFSLGDDSFEDEFEDTKQKVKLSPIPEAILKVYRRIYK